MSVTVERGYIDKALAYRAEPRGTEQIASQGDHVATTDRHRRHLRHWLFSSMEE
jgi:hypothetical protein